MGRIWSAWTGTGDKHESISFSRRTTTGARTVQAALSDRTRGDSGQARPLFPHRQFTVRSERPEAALLRSAHAGFRADRQFITSDDLAGGERAWSKPTFVSDGSTSTNRSSSKTRMGAAWLAATRPAPAAARDLPLNPWSTPTSRPTRASAQRAAAKGFPPAAVNHNEPMFVKRVLDTAAWRRAQRAGARARAVAASPRLSRGSRPRCRQPVQRVVADWIHGRVALA